ncbi:MAG: tRNA 4-thiouridine(8) synthase ThiI [Firmicutes bacterium]|nr:tRNA 4-thiouridine(8) synthase ThiI [Bacillota bacterium]MDD3851973.1 tRNA 4-thiouridine(8) synthase ThiI [Bacillota bacterium]MDD4708337.1 tRNA 4-thiouridine(8) synthase ThiI [Bacillota bacterium]
MEELILVRYGEVALKGGNRSFFINRLVRNIGKSLNGIQHSIIKDRGRILVEIPGGPNQLQEAVKRLKKVFGIVSLSRVVKVEKDLDKIKQRALEMVESQQAATFKVESRRADKAFPVKSPEICRQVGAYILEKSDNTRVDVHNPDLLINIEIRDEAYIFAGFEKGSGGLPTGTGGRGLLLLSGGIDSPVAGWMVAKRGVELEAVHFHSFPFTSERAKQKVIDLAEVLAVYTGGIKLHMVSLTDIQGSINRNCPAEQSTILTRRFMMRIAERIAAETKALALVTGESLGQVASQTLESICVTDSSVDLPVFRPLLGMDKVEIIDRARGIDTYELSILPYEDCCTIFLSEHPETKPRLEKILQSESHLEAEPLISQAVESREILNV